MGTPPSPITILIADDDADDRMMAREALEECRLANDVRFVENGVELLAYLRRQGRFAAAGAAHRPGLILLDLNMPKMDGREALREIKADPALRRTPVVVMTTSKAEEDIYRTYDLGVSSYVAKPVTFEGLVAVMRSIEAYWFNTVQLPEAANREGRTVTGGRPSILIVDDDEDDFVLTSSLLHEVYKNTFEVFWVSDYEAAREAIAGGRHEVCLLDYHLGERTGLQLLREVVVAGCRTPIVLLTGVDDRDIDVQAMEAGAADFLVKGQFGAPLLERSIRYAIGYAAERQEAIDASRLSEERYALAVRGANDGLWDWDLANDRVYYAPRWKSMLGYEEGRIGDSRDEWFSRIHPDDADRVRAEINQHFSGGSPQLETEHRILHDDGSYRWVLVRGIAVRDAGGKAVRAAGSQTDITPRKAAEDRLLHDAFHDALTGLPNRALLLDRLGRSVLRANRRAGYRFAVLFLDLDGFKVVNDSLGHQAGDQLLIALSRRLVGCVRQGDSIARLGGDEFIVFMEEVDGPSDVTALAERVLQELQAPFCLDGHDLVTTASIGIAMSGPQYDRAETLLRDADIAMYQAKSRGKSGYVIFDEVMHTNAVTRMKLEADLRQASLRDEFLLHYQPIISLRTGRVSGFEALIRWDHPDRGVIHPDEFIPVAEETKLILPLGLWVLRKAADQLRSWQSSFRGTPPLTVSVNLSCRQFFQSDLVYQIERILLETGLDARCLRLEITESVLMDQVESALAALARLKSLGIRLAIDDFGKGYSSLSYLHQFPCDVLKIDRSFVARLGAGGENSAIVRTILSLAHGLGLEVVAEGIETASQRSLLKELGCEYGQGYLFSRPLNVTDATALLSAPPPERFGTDDCASLTCGLRNVSREPMTH